MRYRGRDRRPSSGNEFPSFQDVPTRSGFPESCRSDRGGGGGSVSKGFTPRPPSQTALSVPAYGTCWRKRMLTDQQLWTLKAAEKVYKVARSPTSKACT